MNKPLSGAIVTIAALATVGAVAQTAAPAAPDRAKVEAAFKKADKNGDGKVSREEAAALPAIATQFDALDKNKDGALDMDEFAAGNTAG